MSAQQGNSNEKFAGPQRIGKSTNEFQEKMITKRPKNFAKSDFIYNS